jgi:hypothetical protein
MKRLAYALLVLLFVARFDLWLFADGRLVGGLPIGLAYHAVYCLAAALVLWLLTRYAWPAGLDEAAGAEPADGDELAGGRP